MAYGAKPVAFLMRNKSDNAHEVLDIMWNKVQGRY